eukprot:TRINITY_DN65388_c0_g1_i1.p1 TRINITY_DN65388_c0_g1~~TRINITY_DN65388_c0_g1_i1.p1  ORF type:complete len:316 (+),score=59.92 TRINITY_DN65388_c0_g1_i1:135-1082(+)
MTSIDKDSFGYNSLGHQSQSQRKQDPIYSISKVSREARRNVFITEKHIKANRLGRESPVKDTIDLPSTLHTNNRDALCSAPSFGYGGRSDFTAIKVDPDSIPTNDAMDLLPDNQQFRYKKDPTIIIGTEPRFQLKNSELIARHQAAFIGRASPGPAAVGDEYGPKFEPTKPRMAPARKFGIKTKLVWPGQGDNPPEVGPGTFERPDVSMGQQHLTHRRNQSTHAFPRGPKLAKSAQSDDIISKYDAARSSLGKQVLNRNRSAPSVGFNQDNRDMRSKTKLCMTRLDEGPKANFAKMRIPMPSLPSEKAVLGSGFG